MIAGIIRRTLADYTEPLALNLDQLANRTQLQVREQHVVEVGRSVGGKGGSLLESAFKAHFTPPVLPRAMQCPPPTASPTPEGKHGVRLPCRRLLHSLEVPTILQEYEVSCKHCGVISG